jgi:hypothetical protein
MNVDTVGPKEEIFSIVPGGRRTLSENINPALRTGQLLFAATEESGPQSEKTLAANVIPGE